MVPASSTRQAGSARGNCEVGAAPTGAGGRHPGLGCVTWGGAGPAPWTRRGHCPCCLPGIMKLSQTTAKGVLKKKKSHFHTCLSLFCLFKGKIYLTSFF